MRPEDAYRAAVAAMGALCTCGHPAAVHEFTDDEPGPCWHTDDTGATFTCGCDTYTTTTPEDPDRWDDEGPVDPTAGQRP